MTAEQILTARYSIELFPWGCDVRSVYANFMKQWHPDICKHPRANEIFAKINEMYKIVQKMNKVSTSSGFYSERSHPLGVRRMAKDFMRYIAR